MAIKFGTRNAKQKIDAAPKKEFKRNVPKDFGSEATPAGFYLWGVEIKQGVKNGKDWALIEFTMKGTPPDQKEYKWLVGKYPKTHTEFLQFEETQEAVAAMASWEQERYKKNLDKTYSLLDYLAKANDISEYEDLTPFESKVLEVCAELTYFKLTQGNKKGSLKAILRENTFDSGNKYDLLYQNGEYDKVKYVVVARSILNGETYYYDDIKNGSADYKAHKPSKSHLNYLAHRNETPAQSVGSVEAPAKSLGGEHDDDIPF